MCVQKRFGSVNCNRDIRRNEWIVTSSPLAFHQEHAVVAHSISEYKKWDLLLP